MLSHTRLYPSDLSTPQNIVLLLHGYGSNKDDLISLAPIFASALPQTLYVSVNAPEPSPNPGGYQWFDLSNRERSVLLQGAAKAYIHVSALIDALLDRYQLPAGKLALCGFSQGAMMSLYAGLHYPQPLAGILAYSGAFLADDTLQTAPFSALPIQLVHGEWDDVVPFTSMADAVKNLTALGLHPRSQACPQLDHGIDERGIETGRTFLQEILT